MSENAVTLPFVCPGCSATLDTAGQVRLRCPLCNWVGDVYLFAPKALDIEPAKMALPDDASCIHHPRKKAVAVCAGTGDYICSLCAVELNGQTYSASYLEGAGKQLAGSAFDRILPRPDGRILLYMLLCFVPYINVIFLAFAFIWIPHAVFLYFKVLRVRRESAVMRRLVGKGRLITIAILLVLFTLGWIAGVITIVVLIMNRQAMQYGR